MNSWLIYLTLAILLLMSILTWTIVVIKYRRIKKENKLAHQFLDEFWLNQDWNVAQSVAKNADNDFATIAKITFQEFNVFTSLLRQNKVTGNIRDYVEKPTQQALQMIARDKEQGLSILASIGSTAPFVGLFGTVWGIYHALMGIGQAGQATIDQVAGPIGEALVMTALGLAVAIPAVLGYNALVRANKTIMVQLKRFAHDLHALQVTGARVPMH